jgi:hypothetical protein
MWLSMLVGLYVLFLCVAAANALTDWRRGWMYVVVCGVIQDPVRKVTSGTSVMISFLVVVLYFVILFAARNEIIASLRDFARRFAALYAAIFVFILLLIVSALNGLFTYGFDTWKVPAVSFLTYTVPMIAVLMGYVWLQREEMLYRFFRWYAMLTSVALIGSILEYFRVHTRLLGMVAFEGDYIRHLPGIQIRLLSGFYRSPDIMAWHASTLTVIGLAMAMKHGLEKQSLIWVGAAGWGFVNCMMAGRRKAIYYVLVFVAVFLWRYIKRVQAGQLFAMLGIGFIIFGIVQEIAGGADTNVYARGAIASQEEIAGRLEGGVFQTFEQFGLMGAGLGTATQGVRRFMTTDNIGWQEGGLGKLAIEVGLPGLIALAAIAVILANLTLRLTRIGDVPGSSQFLRATLLGLVVANAASFTASAQAYSDAVLSLMAGFFAGCLFASAALDERLPPAEPAAEPAPERSPVVAISR